MLDLKGVEVAAVCDLDDNAAARVRKLCREAGERPPSIYARGSEDYRRLLDLEDLDGVIVTTPWERHATMGLAAFEARTPAAIEVPAAVTIDERWQLVEVAERTGVSATMLENWVYRREPLAVLNIMRAGLLEEIVYCESAHIDPTCDQGGDGTFLCLVGRLLHAVRIASENASELRSAAERTARTKLLKLISRNQRIRCQQIRCQQVR